MATFQCEEGLIPSGPTTSTCADTETGGQWLPNPADTQCTVSTTTGEETIAWSKFPGLRSPLVCKKLMETERKAWERGYVWGDNFSFLI